MIFLITKDNRCPLYWRPKFYTLGKYYAYRYKFTVKSFLKIYFLMMYYIYPLNIITDFFKCGLSGHSLVLFLFSPLGIKGW